MELMHVVITGAGVSFIGIGLVLRTRKKNWRAFFFGGVTLLILVIISLVSGLSM